MATIIDLSRCADALTRVTCDVCIVGAGAAGLYLANRLSRQGMRIVIVEAGGATALPGAALGMDPEFAADRYEAALGGRAFGWGGSTSRWGGLLIPHSELDLRDGTGFMPDVWKHIVDVVSERTTAVFSALSLEGPPAFFSQAHANGTLALLRRRGLETLVAEYLPFRARNLSFLAARPECRDLTAYVNAVACGWEMAADAGSGAGIAELRAISPASRRLSVSARSYVISAGAIESARILLELDAAFDERVLPRSAATGRYLSDHLSCNIAAVPPRDVVKTAAAFGPTFHRGRMRSLRLIERARDPAVPRNFAHFIFDVNDSGFRLARELLSSVQARRLPRVRATQAVRGFGGLCRVAYERLARSRLYIPGDTPVRLQLDIEQAPQALNRVSLGDRRDGYGRRTAVIRWALSDVDHRNIRAAADRILLKWPADPGLPRLLPAAAGDSSARPYDAYHPVGTCRMGLDAEATVDLNLRVRGTRNLYLLSTAVLPSAGTANPTFSMLCLGERLVERLANESATAAAAACSP